jgi:hypothetical protein
MNKLLLVCTLATVATLTACDNKGTPETKVIERETIREVKADAPTVIEVKKDEATVVEVKKDEAKGDSLSISVGKEGSSFEVHATDK